MADRILYVRKRMPFGEEADETFVPETHSDGLSGDVTGIRSVVAVSRTEAEAMSRNGVANGSRWALVSISDSRQVAPDIDMHMPHSPEAVLFLHFDDVEANEKATGLVPMSADDARKVAGFVRHLPPEVTNLVVHCGAGVSRSAGVAAAISLALLGSDRAFFQDGGKCPNITCYRRTLEAFGLTLGNDAISQRERDSEDAYRKANPDKFE